MLTTKYVFKSINHFQLNKTVVYDKWKHLFKFYKENLLVKPKTMGRSMNVFGESVL